MAQKKQSGHGLTFYYPFIIIVTGSLALLASVMIMHEGIAAIKNPNFVAVCDINPIFSCGNVMKSAQSSVFGFENTYLGLIGFPAVITVGVAMLAGATFKRWFWQAFLAGMTLAQGFIFWLMYQSIYSVGSLCLFCMLLWATVTIGFWYTLVYTLREGYVKMPTKLQKVEGFVQRHHVDILIGFFLVVTAVILNHFWYYFGTLL